MEIMLSGNFAEDYITNAENKIKKLSDEYCEKFEKSSLYLEKLGNSELEVNVVCIVLQYAIQYCMTWVWRLIDMAITKTANVNVRIQENIKQKAEQILETIGVPRATAIDMFYRQIILNNGIPFSLTIPKSLPAQDAMDEKTFNALMDKGYEQAVQGDSYPIDDVFEELERGL